MDIDTTEALYFSNDFIQIQKIFIFNTITFDYLTEGERHYVNKTLDITNIFLNVLHLFSNCMPNNMIVFRDMVLNAATHNFKGSFMQLQTIFRFLGTE